ncbi:MAG: hypothetical protein AVDCRST_MAG58-3667, partial [uncultured Rubrobacteraceae bacterium]
WLLRRRPTRLWRGSLRPRGIPTRRSWTTRWDSRSGTSGSRRVWWTAPSGSFATRPRATAALWASSSSAQRTSATPTGPSSSSPSTLTWTLPARPSPTTRRAWRPAG